MASDYLLEIDGIKGESSDQKVKGAIEIESFSWGLSQARSRVGSGGGGGAGKASFQDFHFTNRMDKSSPLLMLTCATGQHIKKATLHVRKAGTEQQEYYTVTLSDLLVSSFQQGGAGGDVPMDQFSLNFSKIEIEYKFQDATGQTDSIKAGWDVKTNSKV